MSDLPAAPGSVTLGGRIAPRLPGLRPAPVLLGALALYVFPWTSAAAAAAAASAAPVPAGALARIQGGAGLDTSASAVDLPVRERVLSNGLRVLVLERSSAPTVAMVVRYGVGSVHEPPGQTGVAHVLEHLLFKGSRSIGTRAPEREAGLFPRIDAAHDSLMRAHSDDAPPAEIERLAQRIRTLEAEARAYAEPNEFSRLLSAHGARGLNATTTSEATTYFVEMPANRVEVWMRLEGDRMSDPVLREFHTERDVVIEERRTRVDTSPGGRLYEAHLAAAFVVHPYGQPVIGHRADLERLSRRQVADFHRRRYGAAAAVVAIVGDVRPEQIFEWAERYLASVPAGEPPSSVPHVEPDQRGERRVEVEFDAEPQVRIGWKVPAAGGESGAALAVTAQLLTGGRTSRLYRRLVLEDRSATFVASSTLPGASAPGLFTIEAAPRAPHGTDEVERAIYEEIARLARDGPDPDELDRMAGQLALEEIRGLRSNLGLALRMAEAEGGTGDWREAFLSHRRMRAVTAEVVRDLSRRYLTRSGRTVATLVRPPARAVDPPESGAVQGPTPTGPSAPATRDPNADRAAEPARGEPGPGARSERSELSAWVRQFSPPGLRLRSPDVEEFSVRGVPILLVVDESLPIASVMIRFQGGYGRFPRSDYGALTGLPAFMRNGGTAAMPPDTVDVRLERLGVSGSFGGGGESQFTSFDVLSDRLTEALAIWTELLRRPRFDSAAIEVWRGRELESVRRRIDAPARLAYSEFNRIMFGDHPIGWELGPDDLEPGDLAEARLRALHARIVCRDNMSVGLVGDVDRAALERQLEGILEQWPACPADLPAAPEPTVRTDGGVFWIPRDLDQTTVVLGQPTAVRLRPDDDYFASRIANAVLGSSGFSSRLMTRVRTEAGLAYGASSLWTAPRRSGSILGAVTQTRSDAAADAAELILDAFDEMAREPPTGDEVAAVVDETVNGFVFGFQSPIQIVSRLMGYRAIGLPDDWLQRYSRRIQRVGPEDVRAVMGRHYDRDRVTLLFVGGTPPEDLARFGPVIRWSPDPPD